MPINPLINRFRDLQLFVPEGTFYGNDGILVPQRDTPYVLQFTTEVPNRQFGVFLNSIFQGVVQTDGSGDVTLTVLLNLGENALELVDGFTQERTQIWLSSKNYATWFAAQAAVFEQIDDYIDTTRIDSQLANCFPQDLEAVWGVRINQSNDVGYDSDTYIELLEDLLLAKRLFGSKVRGLEIALGAFCQVNPIIYPRKFKGKRWILGFQYLNNNDFSILSTELVYATTPLSGVEALSVSEFIGSGSGSFSWSSPILTFTTPHEGTGTVSIDPNRDGLYNILGSKQPARIISALGPYVVPATLSGTTASVTALNPFTSVATLSGLTGMTAAGSLNQYIKISGASSSGNNSTAYPDAFLIVGWISSTSVQIYNPAAVVGDANNGAIHYTLFASLSINIDNLGQEIIPIPPSTYTSTTLVTQITTWFSNDPRYSGYTSAVTDSGSRVRFSSLVLGPSGSVIAYPSPLSEIILGLSTDQLPFVSTGYIDTLATVNVVNASLPSVPTTSNFTSYQAPMPDGWIVLSATAVSVEFRTPEVFAGHPACLVVTVGTTDTTIQTQAVSEVNNYLGFPFTLGAWLAVASISGGVTSTTVFLGWSFDGGSTWTEDAGHVITVVDDPLQPPVFISAPLVYDPYAISLTVRLRCVGQAGKSYDLLLSWVQLIQPNVTAAFLGFNTIPRNRHRSFFGEQIFAWCPDQLSTFEQNDSGLVNVQLPVVSGNISLPTGTIGVDSIKGFSPLGGQFNVVNTTGAIQTITYTGTTLFAFTGCTGGTGSVSMGATIYSLTAIPFTPNGQLDLISACHTQIDRFNVTEFDVSTQTTENLAGVIYEADWINATLVNLSIETRTPDRFTHVIPTVVGPITETLFFSQSGSNEVATLSNISDQNPLNTIVFLNGIPITQDKWIFTSSLTIQIPLVEFSSGSTYTIQYQPLLQATTAAIDLGINWSNYVWYADFYSYIRYDAIEVNIPIVGALLTINFTTFIATLDIPAVTDQTITTIHRYDGITEDTLTSDSWAFLSPTTISINGSEITPSALYTIDYAQQGLSKPPIVDIQVQIRSASTEAGLMTASYQPIEQNAPVRTTGGLRYHQLQATMSGAVLITDFRLSSLVLKGLDIFGTGGVPGLAP